MRLVLDTCVLKLGAFNADDNPSALTLELCLRGLVEHWASPSILEEYCSTLSDDADFLAEFLADINICYPLTRLCVVRHEPDNRFLECALAVHADYLITVNTAAGHFDRKRYEDVRIATPGEFVRLNQLQPLISILQNL